MKIFSSGKTSNLIIETIVTEREKKNRKSKIESKAPYYILVILYIYLQAAKHLCKIRTKNVKLNKVHL